MDGNRQLDFLLSHDRSCIASLLKIQVIITSVKNVDRLDNMVRATLLISHSRARTQWILSRSIKTRQLSTVAIVSSRISRYHEYKRQINFPRCINGHFRI